MNDFEPLFINWKLVKDFNLSEKALVAYVAILKSCKLVTYQILNPLSLVKNLFGVEAKNTTMIRQGLDELIQKEVIKVSYREKRVVFYDLTLLDKHEKNTSIKEDLSFFSKFRDLNSIVCNLYRLYILIQFSLSQQRANGGDDVWATSKKDLAESLECSRYVIGDRLEELKTQGLIAYEDYSKYPVLAMNGKTSLFISLPAFEEDIPKKLKKTIPLKYLKGIVPEEEPKKADREPVSEKPDLLEEEPKEAEIDVTSMVETASERRAREAKKEAPKPRRRGLNSLMDEYLKNPRPSKSASSESDSKESTNKKNASDYEFDLEFRDDDEPNENLVTESNPEQEPTNKDNDDFIWDLTEDDFIDDPEIEIKPQEPNSASVSLDDFDVEGCADLCFE